MKQLKNKWYVIVIVIVLFSVLFVKLPSPREEVVDDPYTGSVTTQTKTYIYVDIKGEVNNPGVYKILDDTRLFELIEMAGGFTNEANDLAINRSILLEDQDVIIIPSMNDMDATSGSQNTSGSLININTASSSELERLPNIGPATAQAIINYRDNTSSFLSIEDIMNVPGIGESTFEAIKDLITV